MGTEVSEAVRATEEFLQGLTAEPTGSVAAPDGAGQPPPNTPPGVGLARPAGTFVHAIVLVANREHSC